MKVDRLNQLKPPMKIPAANSLNRTAQSPVTARVIILPHRSCPAALPATGTRREPKTLPVLMRLANLGRKNRVKKPVKPANQACRGILPAPETPPAMIMIMNRAIPA